MNTVMVIGMLATFFGALWAGFERDNPHYWAFWGMSKNAANVINIVTTLLFPGGYILILFAPGNSWLFNIAMVLLMHFVGVQIIAGIVSGAIAGLAARRRMREAFEEVGQDDDAQR